MDFDIGDGSSKHSQTHTEFVIGSSRHSREGSGKSRHWSDETESSKYSRRALQLDDETESSKHSNEGSGSYEHSRNIEFDYETISSRHSSEGIGSTRDSDIYSDIIDKRGGNESNHFEITTDFFKGWRNDNDFETYQELIDGSYSSKQSEVIQAENDRNEGHIVLFSTEKMRLSSSSPSSSSQSCTDDQSEADIKLSKSARSGITSTSFPKFHEDTEKILNGEHRVSGNKSSKSEECQTGTVGVSWESQVSSVIRESTSTQSPLIQVMDRLGDYDPSRIPSAVFARSQSTNPEDWSIASNDSLFSIQVGNNSFSRDHILSLKSGELFKSGEFIAISPSPAPPAACTDKKSVKLDKSEAALLPDDAVKKKAGKSVEEPIHENQKHPMVSWNASRNSKHSDDSATSGGSFTFPTRKKKNKEEEEEEEEKKQKKCARPSCYCSNCSWAFCYCKWPSCSFRWPSCCFRWSSCYCSNCSWAFCCCWNCSIKRWCCHFSTSLTDRGNEGTKIKLEEQRQEQPLASALSSKSACCSCCSWFPSCGCGRQWCCCCSCNSCRCNCY